MARPLGEKKVKQKKAEAIKYFGEGYSWREVAKLIGVNNSTFTYWRQQDEQFKEDMEYAIYNYHRPLVKVLYDMALGEVQKSEDFHLPNLNAIKWILANRLRDTWIWQPQSVVEEEPDNTEEKSWATVLSQINKE